MPTNVERAGVIARQVELESVTLHSASVTSKVDPLEPPGELLLRQSYRGRYELPEQHPDHVYVYVDLQFAAVDPEVEPGSEAPEHEWVTLEATYLLVYSLSEAHDQPQDALQHFAELNGTYNLWPYWRELVQTVTGRIGLAAIVVPVFRPPVKALDEEPDEESHEEVQ